MSIEIPSIESIRRMKERLDHAVKLLENLKVGDGLELSKNPASDTITISIRKKGTPVLPGGGGSPAVTRMRVTATAPGGNQNLLTCRTWTHNADGTDTLGTTDIIVRRLFSSTFNAVLFAAQPAGGTDQVFGAPTPTVVAWQEVVPGGGNGRYKVLMIVDDQGALDWDWPRFH